jgi:hypothetical protein
MKQSDLVSKFIERPQNFAWFLGAGASRSSGLKTVTDVIWDLKLRYYCKEENQDINQQDIQNSAVKARIQSFMDSRGFPAQWADEEYTTYFEKIFGEDKERQRKYIQAVFSEENVSLSVGNRILGAFMSTDACRAAFTTNFDSVVEKAVAEISGKTLSAYHLEGAHNALQALNNEEYPFYCKIHGDFRYDSIKNLSTDLAAQNEELSKCLLAAAAKFGFIVAGYSGRDASVIELFRQALAVHNAFPHGLFWTGMRGSTPLAAVTSLLQEARDKGITAEYIETGTFDSLMLALWRNWSGKTNELDRAVKKARLSEVNITIPGGGQNYPLLRINALPIADLPKEALSLVFKTPKEWADLRQALSDSEGQLIFTKSDTILCWGTEATARATFGTDIASISVSDIPTDIQQNLHVKNFLEAALCKALAKDKPLLSKTTKYGSYLITDPHATDIGCLNPLQRAVGKPSGIIPGLFSQATEERRSQQVQWAECLRLSIEIKNGQLWLLLEPDIWIWPQDSRRDARTFLDSRRGKRYNKQHSELLDAWTEIIFDAIDDNEGTFRPFANGNAAENPTFRLGRKAAFTKRLSA